MNDATGKQPLAPAQPPAGQEALERRLAAARAFAASTGRERELLAEARATVNALKAEAFSAGYRTPTATDTSALWRMDRDRPADEGGSPWWSEVNVYCFTSGFDRTQVAWKYWQESLAGRRAGPRNGYPRFKKKGRAAESFSLFHDVNPGHVTIQEVHNHLTKVLGLDVSYSTVRGYIRIRRARPS